MWEKWEKDVERYVGAVMLWLFGLSFVAAIGILLVLIVSAGWWAVGTVILVFLPPLLALKYNVFPKEE